MSKRIAIVTTALMLAIGAGGAASAADSKKAPAQAHPRSQASLQCSADANAKGLHGKERVAFRRDCLNKAKANTASYQKPATGQQKVEKTDKKT